MGTTNSRCQRFRSRSDGGRSLCVHMMISELKSMLSHDVTDQWGTQGRFYSRATFGR